MIGLIEYKFYIILLDSQSDIAVKTMIERYHIFESFSEILSLSQLEDIDNLKQILLTIKDTIKLVNQLSNSDETDGITTIAQSINRDGIDFLLYSNNEEISTLGKEISYLLYGGLDYEFINYSASA